ncbi:tRNA threonylcarbamoyladenosine dehydratase [Marinicella pacifica]|jgi:tRNA A37 threonylcarbamoyladenosine dehydratase|uniref:tRNA threonylcarbamoyladenosine dehydratase n=1 Tax=Marinicella pacifica TaxID=1171543 RepID=A0A917CND0_9GAMM|nr:tRNA threonylcarbamoyladenosine dehydratase [Marinicella pacifica]GGF93462.1 tRNA threonylcarbamoyladenosine dehydratase [Marinicella pacifica]
MKERFGGVERLYGATGFEQLQQAHVAIVGIGGVGCWAAEMLARSGVGEMTLVDADEVCVTNINRQIHALNSTVGQAKVIAMKDRISDINPECVVHAEQQFFMAQNAEKLLNTNFDYLIDAVDSVKHKVLLLAACRDKKIPIVTTGGAGGKRQTNRLQIKDLAETHGDRLLKKVRYELRRQHGFKYLKKFNIPAIFSDEAMTLPFCEPDKQTSYRLDCDSGYGTSPTVISGFGILAADWVIQALTAA